MLELAGCPGSECCFGVPSFPWKDIFWNGGIFLCQDSMQRRLPPRPWLSPQSINFFLLIPQIYIGPYYVSDAALDPRDTTEAKQARPPPSYILVGRH